MSLYYFDSSAAGIPELDLDLIHLRLHRNVCIDSCISYSVFAKGNTRIKVNKNEVIFFGTKNTRSIGRFEGKLSPLKLSDLIGEVEKSGVFNNLGSLKCDVNLEGKWSTQLWVKRYMTGGYYEERCWVRYDGHKYGKHDPVV